MFSPSHLKTSHPFPVKSSSSSSSSSTSALSSMKMKNLIHTLIVSHVCRIIRALSKVKAAIVEILKDMSHSNIHYSSSHRKKHCSSKTKKIIMGSFRLHYNWCSSKSSHVIPVPSRVYEGLRPAAEQQGGEDCCHDSELAGYLQWLEENVHGDDGGGDKGNGKVKEIKDVDMLAEMFIANCHEKFRLEKQESDRMLQEMLARSM